jgi:hypothetical protein
MKMTLLSLSHPLTGLLGIDNPEVTIPENVLPAEPMIPENVLPAEPMIPENVLPAEPMKVNTTRSYRDVLVSR